MAKKKTKTAKKKPATRKSSKKTTGAKTTSAASKRTAKKKPATKRSTTRKPTATKRTKKVATSKVTKTSRAKKVKSLGRPRLPGDAEIERVFKNDFEARKVCEFLQVRTLRDLEKFDPDEIVARLKAPMVQTVGRIRKILAMANRSLSGDEAFAIEFRDRYAPGEK